MKVMPSIIKHIPTRIAVYNGSAIEKAAMNIATIPMIKINNEATFDIVESTKRPKRPMNINTNAIK